jgi:hypothetical protein
LTPHGPALCHQFGGSRPRAGLDPHREEAEAPYEPRTIRHVAAAIGQFARRYVDQNERDHAQLVNAIAAGAVESLPG